MKQINIPYTQILSCFHEAKRENITINEVNSATPYREGEALIDPQKTPLNIELIPHHPALDVEDYTDPNRNRKLMEYHKSVTGRYPRMKGTLNQQSKAVGCIITLPRDYIHVSYMLTDKEYIALGEYLESGRKKPPSSPEFISAINKITKYSLSEENIKDIEIFFRSALKAWQKNAGIRDEDMLYAVVHMDETQPHLHIAALPTYLDITKDGLTFSIEKFNNYKTHYFDRMHPHIIELMKEDGIDASGLLNDATKERKFEPKDVSRSQRKKGVILEQTIRHLTKEKEKLSNDNARLKDEKNNLTKEKKALSKELKDLRGEKLLTAEQNEGLKNRIANLNHNKGKVTLEITRELKKAINESTLVNKNLNTRSKSIAAEKKKLLEDKRNFENIVNKRVSQKLPEVIRDYQLRRIPETKKKEAELANKEQEMLEQARKNKEQEEENRRISSSLNEIINLEVKKRLSKKLREKIDAIFRAFENMIYGHFRGHHQENLVEAIKTVELPKDFMVEGKDYGGKTIEHAIREAESWDIKTALHDHGVDYTDIENRDVVNVRMALNSGKSIDEAVQAVAETIYEDHIR